MTTDADEMVAALRSAMTGLDLTLWSASGAHVFNSETALNDLARSLLARIALTDAWNEANAVMPGAWRVRDVQDLMIGGPPNDHAATAVSIGMLPAGTCIGYGDSPDDALHALTERLREKRDGSVPPSKGA